MALAGNMELGPWQGLRQDANLVGIEDFDSDGRADLAITDYEGTWIFRNTRGRFRRLPYKIDRWTTLADFNGDGIQDLNKVGERFLRWFDPRRKFEIEILDLPVRKYLSLYTEVSLSDLDMDGDGDFAVTRWHSPYYPPDRTRSWAIYQTQPGSFPIRESHEIFASANGSYEIEDIDGDGFEDYLTWVPTAWYTGYPSASYIVFGQTRDRRTLTVGNGNDFRAIADIDRNTMPDILYKAYYLENRGNRNFREAFYEAPEFDSPYQDRLFPDAVADLDGDGWLDIVNEYGAEKIAFFRGKGKGEFIPDTALQCGGTVGGVADFDGDGMLDVLVTSFDRKYFIPTADRVRVIYNRLSDRRGEGPEADSNGDLNADLFLQNGDDVFAINLDARGRNPGARRKITSVRGSTVLAAHDLNRDRWADLLVKDPSGEITLRFGPGFTRSRRLSLPDSSEIACCSDLNGDHHRDLILRTRRGYQFLLGPQFVRTRRVSRSIRDQILAVEPFEGVMQVLLRDPTTGHAHRRTWSGRAVGSSPDSLDFDRGLAIGATILKRGQRNAEFLFLKDGKIQREDGTPLIELMPGDIFIGPR